MKGNKSVKIIDNEVPGPGNYNIKPIKDSDGVPMLQNYANPDSRNKNPGPGSYTAPQFEVNHEKFPEWTIKGI